METNGQPAETINPAEELFDTFLYSGKGFAVIHQIFSELSVFQLGLGFASLPLLQHPSFVIEMSLQLRLVTSSDFRSLDKGWGEEGMINELTLILI